MIFEAKRRNAGICGTCHKWLAIWTFISAGRRVTQVSKKLLSACAVNRFCSSRVEKKIRKYDFQSSQANIHPAIFSSSRSFSARVLLATQRPQTPTRQRYDAMSNCKPKSTFLVHLLVFLVGAWTLVSIFEAKHSSAHPTFHSSARPNSSAHPCTKFDPSAHPIIISHNIPA